MSVEDLTIQLTMREYTTVLQIMRCDLKDSHSFLIFQDSISRCVYLLCILGIQIFWQSLLYFWKLLLAGNVAVNSDLHIATG